MYKYLLYILYGFLSNVTKWTPLKYHNLHFQSIRWLLTKKEKRYKQLDIFRVSNRQNFSRDILGILFTKKKHKMVFVFYCETYTNYIPRKVLSTMLQLPPSSTSIKYIVTDNFWKWPNKPKYIELCVSLLFFVNNHLIDYKRCLKCFTEHHHHGP